MNIVDPAAQVWGYLSAGVDPSAINVQCYANAVALGTTNTNSGSGTTASVAIVTQDTNNFVVGGFAYRTGTGYTWSAATGNLRDNYDGTGASGTAIAAVDNTDALATSVTVSATLGGSEDWVAVAVELRSTITAPPSTRRPIAPVIFQ
jgi:hypothetical protein